MLINGETVSDYKAKAKAKAKEEKAKVSLKIDDNSLKNKTNKTSLALNRISRTKLCSDKEAESGAERYIRLLEADDSRAFFLKVMYHLPYDVRENILERALRGSVVSHKAYFLHCAKAELELRGY